MQNTFLDSSRDNTLEENKGEDSFEPREEAAPSMNQPLFVDNPIVACFSNNVSQKYMIEEIFRSQMKLISDTVAKEFFFILEFFDFKASNKTQ